MKNPTLIILSLHMQIPLGLVDSCSLSTRGLGTAWAISEVWGWRYRSVTKHLSTVCADLLECVSSWDSTQASPDLLGHL